MISRNIFTFLALFLQALFFLGTSFTSESPAALLEKGATLVKKGEWDASEKNFLKAAESPNVEDRIQAYQSLEALYRKVKLPKKADRIQKKRDGEKQFLELLVPSDDSYYELYEVKKGDSYVRLSYRYSVSEEWIRLANESKPLIIGDKIKLPKLKYEFIVDKDKKTLTWMRGREKIKTYPISTGKTGSDTPEGEFKIISKVKNPIWYQMNQTYPPDSPENLLGTRWMGIDRKGYGIHGTRHPTTIGTAASHGCVRMFNRDVEELFRWTPFGTKVVILPEKKKNTKTQSAKKDLKKTTA
jgi:lipoprotein-anchoring transpeptidase ErfK/SrfK